MSKEVWFREINEECGYGVDQEGNVRHVDDETTAPPIDETPSLNSDWSKRRNSFLENAAKSVGQYKMAVGAKASYGINSKVTNAYEDLGSIQERIVSNRKKAKKYGIYNYNLQDKINSSELTTNIIDKTIKVYDSIKKMHIIIGTIKVIGIIIR